MFFRLIKCVMLLVISLVLLSFTQISTASAANLDMELQEVNLADAIRMIAKFTHINVIISPSVTGSATLHVRDAAPRQTLDLLLLSHGLAKWQYGNVWYIAPQEELVKRKQDEVKWQTAFEESAPLVTQLWQMKYAKAEDIARVITDERASLLSKRGHVRVDARTNVICIQDTAACVESARKVIHRLDVPVQQILIEARLASVDTDFERELGLIFAVKAKTDSQANPAKTVIQEAGRYSIAVAALADGSKLDVKLSALENAGHAELISNPSLFTANQQPASIEAGEDVPYQEVSESGGTATTFKKAVLGLKVTPQVLPGNRVLLQLQINQDRPSNKMVLGVPTISTRQIITNVLTKSGQTIVLGGIYETNKEDGQQRLPFLSELPLIGLLFKQQITRESKRELLIFVTPRIITQE